MNTREYIVDDTIYTLISEEDCEIENNSSYIVRIVYSDVQPAIDTVDFHRLKPNDYRVFKKNNFPDENIYAICENKNQKSRVIVSTGMFETAGDSSTNQLLLKELKHLRVITQETFGSDITSRDVEDC